MTEVHEDTNQSFQDPCDHLIILLISCFLLQAILSLFYTPINSKLLHLDL